MVSINRLFSFSLLLFFIVSLLCIGFGSTASGQNCEKMSYSINTSSIASGSGGLSGGTNATTSDGITFELNTNVFFKDEIIVTYLGTTWNCMLETPINNKYKITLSNNKTYVVSIDGTGKFNVYNFEEEVKQMLEQPSESSSFKTPSVTSAQTVAQTPYEDTTTNYCNTHTAKWEDNSGYNCPAGFVVFKEEEFTFNPNGTSTFNNVLGVLYTISRVQQNGVWKINIPSIVKYTPYEVNKALYYCFHNTETANCDDRYLIFSGSNDAPDKFKLCISATCSEQVPATSPPAQTEEAVTDTKKLVDDTCNNNVWCTIIKIIQKDLK